MTKNASGFALATPSEAAVLAFDKAVHLFIRHGRDVPDALSSALAEDPDLAAAHAFAGFAQILLARGETVEAAKHFAQQARKAATLRPLSMAEAALIDGLEAACKGRWKDAADVLQNAIDRDFPQALLIKLAHSLRFMMGDCAGMLELTKPFAARGAAGEAGYGFIMGCHAFALEEAGCFDQAERTAQQALHLAPDDIWAMHALAHVYDATNRTGEGLLWVESGRQSWTHCNNFSHHMAWHLALFNVERGKYERALEIYDGELRATTSEDFRDVANAVSLLKRIQQMGFDVGERFSELYECARRRKSDVTYIFASLHHLLSLLDQNDIAAAGELLQAARESADGRCDQGLVATRVGVPLMESMITFATETKINRDLVALARDLPVLGGSFIQRDIFMRYLILMADDLCDHKMVSQLLALRGEMRVSDSFSEMIGQRMCYGSSTLGTAGREVA